MRTLPLLLLTACVDYGFTAGPDEPAPPLDTGLDDTEQPVSELVVTPTSVDFGEVLWSESASAVVQLENTGVLPLDLTDVALSGDHDAFSVGPLGRSTLAPGQSTDVVVTFTPVDTEDHEDVLSIDSTATITPSWTVDLSGAGYRERWAVDMQITADDQWTGTLDGEPIGGSGQDAWSTSDVLAFELDSGEHVIAVHAQDVGRIIAGFLAVVRVDGEPIAFTGDGAWRVSGTSPSPGWQLPGFDDSAWASPSLCADASPWGGRPTSLTEDGAEWVWHNTNCRSLGEAWFRLAFTLE